jgi:sugar phosphate isomerase/epimerase
MKWSFQLYSARKFQPWEGVLERLATLGYREVEGFAGAYDDPADLRRLLERFDLAMPTGHFAITLLESDFDGACRIADTLGIATMVCPHLEPTERPSDAAGWRQFGERLAWMGERCRAAGYGFAWHNHDFEFTSLPDGTTPQELILETAPFLSWEIDIAWIARGGADAATWIERHAQRIFAVHMKDIAAGGEAADEDGWADVGHGTLDWRSFMRLLSERTPARHFIMEHDNPRDFVRFARRSIEAAQSFREEV